MKSLGIVLFTSIVMLAHNDADAFYSMPSISVTQDSLKIVAPIFKDEKLNAAVYEYGNVLDQYYTDIKSGKPDAISVMSQKLSKSNEKILKQTDLLSDEELNSLETYLDQYGKYIQKQVDLYFEAEIAAMQAELDRNKAEAAALEKEAEEIQKSSQ